jgi:hypothetical protein
MMYRFEYYFTVTFVTIVTKWLKTQNSGLSDRPLLQMLHATLLHVTDVTNVTVKKKSITNI